MDIIETARQLGTTIQQDERYKKFLKAKLGRDNDANLQSQIGEFNLLRLELDKELSKQEKDDAKVQELNEQLREMYSKIINHETMKEYMQTKMVVDEIVNEINAIIGASLNGEDPMTVDPHAHCGGDCSSCGGCH